MTWTVVAHDGFVHVVEPTVEYTSTFSKTVVLMLTTAPLAFSKNSFSSAVLSASSPAARLAAKGTAPGVAERYNWMGVKPLWAIRMFLRRFRRMQGLMLRLIPELGPQFQHL
jgi:hypothetical protein